MKINKNKLIPFVNSIIVGLLVATAWIETHWSVALLLGYMSFSLSLFAHGLKRLNNATLALAQKVSKIPIQMPVSMSEPNPPPNVCRECEESPTGVRSWLNHSRNAPNCLLKPLEDEETITEQQQ